MDAWEAYFWPGTEVLKNLPGIRNEHALRRAEYAATRQRAEALRERPVEGQFDAAHFREVHRRLFQDIYAWAGDYRTVDMLKGGSRFAPLQTDAHTLASWTEKILADLKSDHYLQGLKTADFVARLTHHYGELNYAHPFREGNGRATKEFLAQLAKEAGYALEYHRVDAQTWNAAAARQIRGDPD